MRLNSFLQVKLNHLISRDLLLQYCKLNLATDLLSIIHIFVGRVRVYVQFQEKDKEIRGYLCVTQKRALKVLSFLNALRLLNFAKRWTLLWPSLWLPRFFSLIVGFICSLCVRNSLDNYVKHSCFSFFSRPWCSRSAATLKTSSILRPSKANHV